MFTIGFKITMGDPAGTSTAESVGFSILTGISALDESTSTLAGWTAWRLITSLVGSTKPKSGAVFAHPPDFFAQTIVSV